ncbi:hypothetical protein M0R45_011244 [Rubus argutus]|uniref:BPL/LPL catalytic domain-containing protein n=1 Tax=Rubus argutus TaxID=59490 RepID=A0AAW1YB35_RUBAR
MVSSSTFFTSSLGFFSARSSLKKAIFSPRTKLTACRLASAMDSSSSCTLVLCGKSLAENKIAEALKNTGALKLTDNSELSILLDSELEKPFKEDDAFGIGSFMNSLSTNRFGRLLLWSPRLPSTHDVVSQNFCELPIGAVCVADVQYKGRGRSKNVWESPKAVTEAIKDVCDRNGLPCVDVRIKWPNDLYLNGLKVAGIYAPQHINRRSSMSLLVSA